MKLLYPLGRFLQAVALVVLPASMWAAQISHDEKRSVGIFVGSITVFFLGTVLTRFSGRV